MTAIESMPTWALKRSVKMMERSLAKQNDDFVSNSLKLVKDELKKRNEGLDMGYQNHKQTMLHHGHTGYMTKCEYNDVVAYGLQNDVFEIDSDIQNGWFDTVGDAIGFYVGLIGD